MNLLEAKHLAIQLMKEHGLIKIGWRFEFNTRKRANGVCSHGKKTIYLSSVLTEAREEANVRNTILHEIAHALVGRGHGHDYIWRIKALQIGCDGTRCSQDKTQIDAKYTAECDTCGTTHIAHRRPKRHHWCKCSSRGFLAEKRLQYVQNY